MMTYFQIIQNGLAGYLESSVGLAFLKPLLLLLTVVAGYLVGSVNCGIILSRRMYRDDVRGHGSGNAGSTNMLRTYGTRASLLTFAGDFFKGALAAALGLLLWGYIGGYVAALFAVFGHAFPVYFRFHGGKGVAAAAGAMLVLNSTICFVLILVFVGLVAVSRYVSAGSIIAAMLLPLCVHSWGAVGGILVGLKNSALPSGVCTIIAFLMAALIVILHRQNLKRLLSGKETKFSLKKKGPSASEGKDS